VSDRSHIHQLSAAIFVQHNGKLPMRDCLGVAEAALFEAEYVDAQVQRELDAEEKAEQPIKPLTNQVQ
jgi:hypothetical protein